MGYSSVSFDPAAIATASDAASSALVAAASASDAASSALAAAGGVSDAASNALSAATVAQSKASDASSAAVYATKVAVLNPTPANVSATGMMASFAASEAVAFGNLCYLNANGFMAKADADSAGLGPVVAMALSSIANAATGPFLLHGIVRNDAWNWTPGNKLYLSCTGGTITATQPTGADDVIQVVGVATHADRIYFKPSADIITHL